MGDTHWFATREGARIKIDSEAHVALDARCAGFIANGLGDLVTRMAGIRVPTRIALPKELRAGQIRPSAYAARLLARKLDESSERKFHVLLPPAYPVSVLVVPAELKVEETRVEDAARSVNDAELRAAMDRFAYDLERRTVTRAVLCELPRALEVDLFLRARADCLLLNPADAAARTIAFVLFRKPEDDDGDAPNADEPVSPRAPRATTSDPSIVWATSADEHDRIVASDPDRHQSRLLSDTTWSCFRDA